jgi:hypothetical protein
LNIISLFRIWRRIPKLPEFLPVVLQFALQIGTNQFSADFTRSKHREVVLARDYPQPRGQALPSIALMRGRRKE